jgi:3-phosphoshikimate 1-carboxyvinyltransferase
LESLRIKETDRIFALQTELKKIGAVLDEPHKGAWTLKPSYQNSKMDFKFSCYHDHRMAMGLAPLATQFNIQFDDRTVVNKSYPRYWDDLQACGFKPA